ncbi:AP-3 complex subunit delta, partial [Dissostichus eleginoides]
THGKANAVTELQIQSTYKRRRLPRQSPVRYRSSFLLFRLQRWEPEVVGAIPIGVKERPKQPPWRMIENIISVGCEEL